MGVSEGMLMVLAGSLGGVACIVFLISTVRRFQRQRKHFWRRSALSREKSVRKK